MTLFVVLKLLLARFILVKKVTLVEPVRMVEIDQDIYLHEEDDQLKQCLAQLSLNSL